MTGSPTFVDTNIFIYANDTDEPRKRDIARALLRRLVTSGEGVVSSQVLAEFWVAVTQEIARPLAPAVALHELALLSALRVVPVDHGVVVEAIQIQQEHDLSFSDAQIFAAARAAGCTQLLTEDLQHKRVYGDVMVVNPFADVADA